MKPVDPYSLRIGTAETTEILPLRMSVLRDGTPSQDPRYPEDDLDITKIGRAHV